jgi:hypothetical protein
MPCSPIIMFTDYHLHRLSFYSKYCVRWYCCTVRVVPYVYLLICHLSAIIMSSCTVRSTCTCYYSPLPDTVFLHGWVPWFIRLLLYGSTFLFIRLAWYCVRQYMVLVVILIYPPNLVLCTAVLMLVVILIYPPNPVLRTAVHGTCICSFCYINLVIRISLLHLL